MPKLVLGSLKTQAFGGIWDSGGVLDDLRDRTRLKGSCRGCEFRSLCGGCRARALAYHGDILASDPGCIRANGDVEQGIAEATFSAI